MRKSTKLGLFAFLVLVMLIIGSMPAQAEGKKVRYTASMASMGMPMQFGHPSGAGMALFDDGSAKGNVAISSVTPSVGQLILQYRPLSWVEVVPGVVIQITFELRWIKGFAPFPPIYIIMVPVTGEPTFIDSDGDGSTDLILRVTPVS